MRTSQATGRTKPSATGSAHSAKAPAAAAPRSRTGRASTRCVGRLAAKRSFACARRSTASSNATASSSSDASCAAATRSSIASQALKMPVEKVVRPK